MCGKIDTTVCGFAELIGDKPQKQNVLGLQEVQSGQVVTISSSNTSNRYRVQCNDGLALAIVVQQLVTRLKDRSTSSFSMQASVNHNHLQLIHAQIEKHFAARQNVKKITVSFSK